MMRPQRWMIASATVLSLAACTGEQDELQAWMDQQRHEVHPTVQPLSPPQKFNPQTYAGADGM